LNQCSLKAFAARKLLGDAHGAEMDKPQKGEQREKSTYAVKTISINRAPVLTLWAAMVAQRLGFDEDEALTLGKALAGLNAQAKGRRLGIFKPHEEKPTKARKRERGEEFFVENCGRQALRSSSQKACGSIWRARSAMTLVQFGQRCRSLPMRSSQRNWRTGHLECTSDPVRNPAGVKGWGAKGDLDLALIEELAKGMD
jgi:hypothetical protein